MRRREMRNLPRYHHVTGAFPQSAPVLFRATRDSGDSATRQTLMTTMTRRRRRGVIPAGLTRMSPQPGRARPPAVFTRGRVRTRPPTVRRCCGCCVLLQSCCGCYGLSQSGCGMFWAVAGRSGDRFRGPWDLVAVATFCGLLQPVAACRPVKSKLGTALWVPVGCFR